MQEKLHDVSLELEKSLWKQDDLDKENSFLKTKIMKYELLAARNGITPITDFDLYNEEDVNDDTDEDPNVPEPVTTPEELDSLLKLAIASVKPDTESNETSPIQTQSEFPSLSEFLNTTTAVPSFGTPAPTIPTVEPLIEECTEVAKTPKAPVKTAWDLKDFALLANIETPNPFVDYDILGENPLKPINVPTFGLPAPHPDEPVVCTPIVRSKAKKSKCCGLHLSAITSILEENDVHNQSKTARDSLLFGNGSEVEVLDGKTLKPIQVVTYRPQTNQ